MFTHLEYNGLIRSLLFLTILLNRNEYQTLRYHGNTPPHVWFRGICCC